MKFLKTIFPYFLVMLSWIGIFYGMFAFTEMSFNPALWDQCSRSFVAMFSSLFAFLVMFVYICHEVD